MDDCFLEYCPYCQRYVEPKKCNVDWLGGGLLFGPVGLAAGGIHHPSKSPRCPICNCELRYGGGAVTPQTVAARAWVPVAFTEFSNYPAGNNHRVACCVDTMAHLYGDRH